MSVFDRAALEASPLADIHAIASELSIDGYRRLRRPDLITAILARQSGEEVDSAAPADDSAEETPERPARPRRTRSSQRKPDADEDGEAEAESDVEAEPDAKADTEPKAKSRAKAGAKAKTDAKVKTDAKAKADAKAEDEADEDSDDVPEDGDDDDTAPSRRRRGRRGGRGRGSGREERATKDEQEDEEPAGEDADGAGEDELVSGVVELLPNGSGFVRVSPPEPSDDDVYISGAQVKRCELVSGDQVSGPRRPPRRSERFASLVRIDTINDRPASEVADSARFDDLPAAFPNERYKLGSEDPTIKAVEWLTPIGRGSRVTIVGASGAGKTEALRRLALALGEIEDLQLSVALAGVRPEEISEWGDGTPAPTAAVSFAGSPDAQGNAVELVVDQARRVAARGADAVVLIDTLDGLHPGVARKAMAAARNVVDGGSLTVIATASEPVGGETTVIALDRALAITGHFPALDLVASGTIRAELLIGEDAVKTIITSREEALGAR